MVGWLDESLTKGQFVLFVLGTLIGLALLAALASVLSRFRK